MKWQMTGISKFKSLFPQQIAITYLKIHFGFLIVKKDQDSLGSDTKISNYPLNPMMCNIILHFIILLSNK